MSVLIPSSVAQDCRQMSSLYQTIPSPTPIASLDKVKDSTTRRTIQRLLAGGEDSGTDVGSASWAMDGDLKGLGMTTELYGYQRVRMRHDTMRRLEPAAHQVTCSIVRQRSVAQMLLQESYPERFLDIKFVRVEEVGRRGMYYVDLRSGEIRREKDVGFYEMPRGGILYVVATSRHCYR